MYGVIFILIGLFSMICAIGDFDFFMNHRKAKLFVKLLGRKGTRIFYSILGLGFIVLGVLFSLGIIPI